MDEEQIVNRGRRAKRLLAEGDVQAAFAETEDALLQDIRNTAWDDVRLRECKHAEIRALDRVRQRLQGYADELITRNID
jgi:hypothetical protein